MNISISVRCIIIEKYRRKYFIPLILAILVCALAAGALLLTGEGWMAARGGTTQSAYDYDAEALQIDTEAWNLILINDENPLPENYMLQLKDLEGGMTVDTRIYDALEAMLEAASGVGLSPMICSAYRNLENQDELFSQQVAKWEDTGLSGSDAVAAAKTVVAYPGRSEHNSGLAVDICATYYQMLDDEFEETAEAIWLKEHCAEYGFILRYPADKTEITKVIYEPWHFRYVGVEAAAYIMENDICLEEYLALAD